MKQKLFFILIAIVLMTFGLYAKTIDAESGRISNKKEISIINDDKSMRIKGYLKALNIKSANWYEFWKDKRSLTDTKEIDSIKERLREYLESRGYYNSKISINDNKDIVKVVIHEGKPILVGSVKISSDFNLKRIIKYKKGSKFEASKFIKIKREIKKELMKSGYCNYQIDTKAHVDLVTKRVKLNYIVNKGKICRFGKTKIISKPDNISKDVVKSRLQYSEGDIFNSEKISKTFDSLNQLDAFGSGTVTPQERDIDAKPSSIVPMEVALSAKEKLNVFKGGVGYSSDVGARVQLFYERKNFMGNARKLTTQLHYSDTKQFVELMLFSPAFVSAGNLYLDLISRAGYSQEKYDTYKENKGYYNIQLGYDRDEISFYTGMGLDNIDIKLSQTDPSIVAGNFLILYPFAKFTYDGRDSKINPKNGYYFSAYTEYGLDYKAGASNYFKYLLEGRLIKTIDDLTLASVGKIGSITSYSGALPASKLFYAGGSYSNRAYGDNEIGAVTSTTADSTLGGRTWMNLSLEADYKLYDDIYGALFWDGTMINAKDNDFNGPVISSAGVGIRYETPIGPIKMDVAVNTADTDLYGIHFQIGQSF